MSCIINILLVFLFLSAIVVVPSCTEKQPDKGTLSVRVIKASDGSSVPYELVYLAKTYQDMQNKIHFDSNWTDMNGFFRFRDLDPGVYWYDTQHWEDYGAARVLNAVDIDVILWVQTPDTTVHK